MIPAPFFADVADGPGGAEGYWIEADDGVRLRVVVWRSGGSGTATIFPGRTEYAEKYGRVARRLAALGLSVAVIDWRGQGLSERHPARPELGHVEDFRDYQRDVAALMALLAELGLPERRYLIGHSMGGCIGLRALLERADFRGAVLSAPMWHLQMRAATREVTSKMTQFADLAGLGTWRMPGTRGRKNALAARFESNALTTDRESFDWMMGQLARHPELALGAPSVRWTYAALEEMARLYIAPLPRLPMLVFLGTDETVVSTYAIRSRVAAMPSSELVVCPGARHEIFMEGPRTQTLVWRRIADFLGSAPSAPGRLSAAEG